MTRHGHGTGWQPKRAAAAHNEMIATRRYATVAPNRRATRPAYCSRRARWLFQGGAGTCYTHAAVALEENTALARGYDAFKNSRRLVAWVATKTIRDAPDDNPSDGGSVTDALRAMTEPLGAGIAHEDLCPYTDDPAVLNEKPPDAVFADAKRTHLVLPVPVRSKTEMKALIDAEHPVGIGIPWCDDWDDPETFQRHMGRVDPDLGHALLVCGFAEPGVIDAEACWYVDNWHADWGEISPDAPQGPGMYPPLPPDLAAKVPGYAPWHPKCDSATWFTDSLFDKIVGLGGCEFVSASDLTGEAAQLLVPSAVGLLPV